MPRALAFCLLAIQLCASEVATCQPTQSEDLSLKLNKEVSNYHLGEYNLPGALLRVSSDFRIPMGIVWVDSPAARSRVPFSWEHATVKEIIQAIAKSQPSYQVQVRNGVVHVFPEMPDRENFLKAKIAEFQTHDVMLELASFRLHMLVAPTKGNHQINVAGPGDSLVSVDLKNCNAEDALDALAMSSNRKVWVVTFSDEPTMTSSGLRRTKSVFTDTPLRDDEQPVWYLHRWGDPTPSLLSGAATLVP